MGLKFIEKISQEEFKDSKRKGAQGRQGGRRNDDDDIWTGTSDFFL